MFDVRRYIYCDRWAFSEGLWGLGHGLGRAVGAGTSAVTLFGIERTKMLTITAPTNELEHGRVLDSRGRALPGRRGCSATCRIVVAVVSSEPSLCRLRSRSRHCVHPVLRGVTGAALRRHPSQADSGPADRGDGIGASSSCCSRTRSGVRSTTSSPERLSSSNPASGTPAGITGAKGVEASRGHFVQLFSASDVLEAVS